MLGPSSTIPLRRDPSSRFLPWITALMVYLAGLALAGVIVIDEATRHWQQGSVERLTVQYIPVEGAAQEDAIDRILTLLHDTPGVAEATLLDRDELITLLEPWLGEGNVSDDLPLPRLIDVTLLPGAKVDLETLGDRVAAEVPGAVLDDPRHWLDKLAGLARSVQAVAAGILLLVGAAAVATVVVTTRMGLAIHHEVIEVLHLIGARDSYVARQFQRHALMLGLRGGAIGLALTALTILGIGEAASELEAPLLPAFAFESWGWGLLAALPVVIALAVMLTARLTVLRALARMP